MNDNFRNRVEELIKLRGMTHREFASRLGVSEVTVSRWLNGERNPSAENLNKIAEVLGTTPSYFFIDDSQVFKQNEQEGQKKEEKHGAGLVVTFGVILGLVIAAVAAGILSKDEKDRLVDELKKGDKDTHGRC